MSHECPECYDACHCGGDIDDMLMNDTAEERACGHCEPFSESDYDEPEYDCLDCGTCDGCIRRAIDYAEEQAREETAR